MAEWSRFFDEQQKQVNTILLPVCPCFSQEIGIKPWTEISICIAFYGLALQAVAVNAMGAVGCIAVGDLHERALVYLPGQMPKLIFKNGSEQNGLVKLLLSTGIFVGVLPNIHRQMFR